MITCSIQWRKKYSCYCQHKTSLDVAFLFVWLIVRHSSLFFFGQVIKINDCFCNISFAWMLTMLFFFLCAMQVCVICKQTHGSCTQCCKCATYFHAMCASRAGYSMEVSFLAAMLLMNIFIWCHTFHEMAFLMKMHFGVQEGCYNIHFLYSNKSPFQLHCGEKNGRQITKKLSYCAVHRLRCASPFVLKYFYANNWCNSEFYALNWFWRKRFLCAPEDGI